MTIRPFMKQAACALALLLIATLQSSVAGGSDAATVSIKKYKFIPEVIVVKRGATVVWRNDEKRQYHSVWFEKTGEPEPDYFFPEETFERTFDEVGEFPYRCGPHPEMTGVVRVVE